MPGNLVKSLPGQRPCSLTRFITVSSVLNAVGPDLFSY